MSNLLILGAGQYGVTLSEKVVKGLGYLPEGSIVEYNGKYYVLYFGWHKNISNQEIYSWYLVETHTNQNLARFVPKNPECKTLYKWMIDKLNKVIF